MSALAYGMTERDERRLIETEQAVLGSMMIDRAALDHGVAHLTPADWYRDVHRDVFAGLCSLAVKNNPPDLITLQEELKKSKTLNTVGGTDYLMALVESVPTAANVKYYAAIVRGYSLKRRLHSCATEIQGAAQDPNADPDAMIAWAQARLDEIGHTDLDDLTRMGDDLQEHMDWLQACSKIKGLEGYSTGFSHLDCVTGGYGQPLFVLFKGLRKKGKTHHLIQPIYNCLKSGRAVLLVTMDTPKKIIYNRILAYLTGINSFKMKRLADDQFSIVNNEAAAWLYKQPLYIARKAGTTVQAISHKCDVILKEGHVLGMVAIDYAELLGNVEKDISHEQELTRNATALQNLRDKFETTVILLSQVNKDGGARWSQGLENAVDLILKWEVKEKFQGGGGRGFMQTEGNRLGMDTEFDCWFDFGTSRIRECELDNSEPSYPASWPWWYDGGLVKEDTDGN